MALTHRAALALRPAPKPYDEKVLPGLSLRVYPTGIKSWIFRKRVNGASLYECFGNFPDIGIADARRRAQDLIASMGEGETPHKDRVPTVNEIFDEWIALRKDEIKDCTTVSNALKANFLPEFGPRLFGEIRPADVRSCLMKVSERGSRETARRICTWVGQMERHALGMGYIDVLRLQGLAPLLPRPVKGSQPSVPPSDLPEIMQILYKGAITTPQGWAAIQIAFYTLLRPSEYVSSRWDWIKSDEKRGCYIEVPAEMMKMKKPHRVPVIPQLELVLDRMPRISDYVLPAWADPEHHMVTATLEKNFRKWGLKGRLVPHGIRSMGRTWMAEEGENHAAAEACLAHRIGSDVELAYNRSDLFAIRRGIMERWGNYVEWCIKKGVTRE